MDPYELFVYQQEEVLLKYTKLKRGEVNGLPILKGELDIIDNNGKYWESFSIEIHVCSTYPNNFPSLFETGNKIPRIADWHVYEDTGSCCVKVLPIELIECKKGITLLSYIDYHVLPYLFNQTFRRLNGYYPAGEYSHGIAGIIEFYLEQLNTKNIGQALIWMLQISNGLTLGRTSKCFCGKNIKYRHCHRDAVNKLKLLGTEQLKNHAANIYSKLK